MSAFTAHLAKFETVFYPGSVYARAVNWVCACGAKGGVTDGKQAASTRRARAAHRRHVAHKAGGAA